MLNDQDREKDQVMGKDYRVVIRITVTKKPHEEPINREEVTFLDLDFASMSQAASLFYAFIKRVKKTIK
jgi:hypothetical protein